ncbi:formin homology 2 domain-containing protein [Ditylenchus destructor]|uniref:Formin homology 2 domain-containing protein n=1 Tax=Ditylenchus destructor TaxID=166010 RepID=A0AAD4MGX1_9BILA|nr:formin homology 2 domain-containing protein [Ditylenchus destructor]
MRLSMICSKAVFPCFHNPLLKNEYVFQLCWAHPEIALLYISAGMCIRICFLFLFVILHIPFQRAMRSEDGSDKTVKSKASHFNFLFRPPPPPPAPSAVVLPKYLKPKKQLEAANVPMKKLQWTSQIIPVKQVTEHSVWANNDYTRNASAAVLEHFRNKFSNISNASADIKMAKIFAKAKTPQVIDPSSIMPLQILQASCIRTCAEGVKCWRKAILEVDEIMLNRADNKQIIKQMKDKWPSEEIISKLNTCVKDTGKDGCSGKMIEGEQFVIELATITGLPSRLETILLKLEWNEAVADLRYPISTIADTCEEIRMSKGLKKFLPFVLLAGNYLGKATDPNKSNDAFAFELSVLTKLVDTRAQKPEEGKILETLLHSVIELFDKKYNGDHTQFALRDFPNIAKASKINVNVLLERRTELKTSLKQAADYTSMYKPIQNESDKFLEKVGVFIKQAQNEMADIDNKWDDMQKKCTKLQEYLCFDPQKYSLERLFNDIKQFQGQYAAALEDIKKMKEKENEKMKKPTTIGKAIQATKKRLSKFTGYGDKKVNPAKPLPLPESGDKTSQNSPTTNAGVLPKSSTAPVSSHELKFNGQDDKKGNMGWPLQKFGDLAPQNPPTANAGVLPKGQITSASQPSSTRDDSANNQRIVEEGNDGFAKNFPLPESGVSTRQADAATSDDRVQSKATTAPASQQSSTSDDSANHQRKVEVINGSKDSQLPESGVSTRQTGPTSGDRVQPKESDRTGEASTSTAPVRIS